MNTNPHRAKAFDIRPMSPLCEVESAIACDDAACDGVIGTFLARLNTRLRRALRLPARSPLPDFNFAAPISLQGLLKNMQNSYSHQLSKRQARLSSSGQKCLRRGIGHSFSVGVCDPQRGAESSGPLKVPLESAPLRGRSRPGDWRSYRAASHDRCRVSRRPSMRSSRGYMPSRERGHPLHQ